MEDDELPVELQAQLESLNLQADSEHIPGIPPELLRRFHEDIQSGGAQKLVRIALISRR